jgi:hypothetical protein
MNSQIPNIGCAVKELEINLATVADFSWIASCDLQN